MGRKRKPKLPIVLKSNNEGSKRRLDIEAERFRRFLKRHDEEFARKRMELKIELIANSLRISHEAASYLWRQYGAFTLGSRGSDESAKVFREWLQNSHSGDAALVQTFAKGHHWESRTITIVAYLLPQKAREEWLGDLQESLFELSSRGCATWTRRLITLGRICLLAFALVRIKLSDLLSPGKRRPM